VDVDIGNLINSVICFLSYMGASGYLEFIFISVSPAKYALYFAMMFFPSRLTLLVHHCSRRCGVW
jgi:hypothetical protein